MNNVVVRNLILTASRYACESKPRSPFPSPCSLILVLSAMDGDAKAAFGAAGGPQVGWKQV